MSASDDDQNQVYSVIQRNLHVRAHANAPLRAHRICIIGPPSSGRTTQAKALAKIYGLVHVDLAPLLSKYQQTTGRMVEELPPEYIGDEELCSIVGKRLNETDCRRKGWILDGFPKTEAQAEFLRQSHLWPSRMIALQLTEEDTLERCSIRRVDPVTKAAYYTLPQSVEVKQRLVQAEYDMSDKVQRRYQMHYANLTKVQMAFPLVYSQVVADGAPQDVTGEIQGVIDKALPSELAQDAANGSAA